MNPVIFGNPTLAFVDPVISQPPAPEKKVSSLDEMPHATTSEEEKLPDQLTVINEPENPSTPSDLDGASTKPKPSPLPSSSTPSKPSSSMLSKPSPLPRTPMPSKPAPLPMPLSQRSSPLRPMPMPRPLPKPFDPHSMEQPGVSSLSAEKVEEVPLSEEEKVTFVKAIYFFLSKAASKSHNKTLENLSTILKLTKKCHPGYLHGEELDANKISTAVHEVFVKSKLQYELSKIHPFVAIGLPASEFIDIFRPAIHEALLTAINNDIRAIRGNNNSALPPPNYSTHKLLLEWRLKSYAALYAVVEAGSWPERILNWYSSKVVGAYMTTLVGIGSRFGAIGKGHFDHYLGLAKHILGAESPIPLDFALKVQQLLQEQSRAQTEQDNGGRYECLDQLSKEEVDSDRQELKAEQDEGIKVASDHANMSNRPSFSPPKPGLKWDFLDKPHPLTGRIGGSFSLSGGLGAPPTYSAQVNVTVSGSSNVKVPPAIQSTIQMANTGGEPGPGRSRGPTANEKAVNVYQPIANAYAKYVQSLEQYNTARGKLNEAIDSFSKDDSAHDHYVKCENVIAKTQALIAIAKTLMNDAFNLFALTDKSSRRHYSRDWAADTKGMKAIENAAKELLWNQFGVPRKRSLEIEHLAESSIIASLNAIEATYRTNQDTVQKRSEAITKIDAEISKTDKEYQDKKAAIKAMENSDEPVDPKALSNAIAELKLLGEQLLNHFRGKAAIAPESVSNTQISDIEKQIEDTHTAATLRDARYIKIFSDFKQLRELQASVLPKFIENQNPEEIAQELLKIKEQREALARNIQELTAQCPDNKEKNAELFLLKEEIDSKYSALAFCSKSLEDKSAEIQLLRKQINPSAPDQGEKATNDCMSRYAILLAQLQIGKEYEKFSDNFNQFLGFLLEEDALSDSGVSLISSLCDFIQEGVDKKGINPEKAIKLLENLEKQNAHKPSSPENPLKTLDLNPLCIAIGELMSCSDESTSPRSMQRYKDCKRIQPDKPHWSRLLASCHLKTLHWSLAQQDLLDALANDPNNEQTKKAISALVEDKYNSASLVLEWIQTLSSTKDLTPEQAKAQTKLQTFARGLLKAINVSTNIFSHPSLLRKWLPETLALPEEFKPHLTALLNDQGTGFSAFNITTLATRVINNAASIVVANTSKEDHPNIVNAAKGTSILSQVVQYALHTGSGAYKLFGKYRESKLVWTDPIQFSLSAVHLFPLAVPFLQSLVYKSKQAKQLSQWNRPYLHTVIETLASKSFAATLLVSDLAYRSTDLISRGVQRVTGARSSRIATFMHFAVFGYFFFHTTKALFHEYSKIMDSRAPEGEPHPHHS